MIYTFMSFTGIILEVIAFVILTHDVFQLTKQNDEKVDRNRIFIEKIKEFGRHRDDKLKDIANASRLHETAISQLNCNDAHHDTALLRKQTMESISTLSAISAFNSSFLLAMSCYFEKTDKIEKRAEKLTRWRILLAIPLFLLGAIFQLCVLFRPY